jgi:hypothetical protein
MTERGGRERRREEERGGEKRETVTAIFYCLLSISPSLSLQFSPFFLRSYMSAEYSNALVY